jgi:hypothetical protein
MLVVAQFVKKSFYGTITSMALITKTCICMLHALPCPPHCILLTILLIQYLGKIQIMNLIDNGISKMNPVS